MKLHNIYDNRLFQRGRFDKFDFRALRLKEFGITHVINLCPVKDNHLSAIMPMDTYLHVPIPDSEHFDRVTVERAVRFGVAALKSGGNVLSHCNAGRNRSALINGCLLMDHFGFDWAMAIEIIQIARPNSLANIHFQTYLRQRK